MRTQTVHKYLFLDGMFADSPARAKLSLWYAHSGRLPCGWCRFHGQPVDGVMRYLGYAKEVKQHFIAGQPMCLVGAARLQLTHRWFCCSWLEQMYCTPVNGLPTPSNALLKSRVVCMQETCWQRPCSV